MLTVYIKDFSKFKSLQYMIVDCLRYYKHPSHFNFEDIIKLNFFKTQK